MTVEKRPFGRTGHMSSAVIFGSAALKAVDQGTADRVRLVDSRPTALPKR
jgi:hypothetical protein